jgi:hypothetical protein
MPENPDPSLDPARNTPEAIARHREILQEGEKLQGIFDSIVGAPVPETNAETSPGNSDQELEDFLNGLTELTESMEGSALPEVEPETLRVEIPADDAEILIRILEDPLSGMEGAGTDRLKASYNHTLSLIGQVEIQGQQEATRVVRDSLHDALDYHAKSARLAYENMIIARENLPDRQTRIPYRATSARANLRLEGMNRILSGQTSVIEELAREQQVLSVQSSTQSSIIPSALENLVSNPDFVVQHAPGTKRSTLDIDKVGISIPAARVANPVIGTLAYNELVSLADRLATYKNQLKDNQGVTRLIQQTSFNRTGIPSQFGELAECVTIATNPSDIAL